MIEDPERFPWSSCAAHCGNENVLITPHRAYSALGTSVAERGRAFRVLLHESLSDEAIQEVRAYLQQQRALGRNDFQAMVEAKTHRFAGTRLAHRPRKAAQPPSD